MCFNLSIFQDGQTLQEMAIGRKGVRMYDNQQGLVLPDGWKSK